MRARVLLLALGLLLMPVDDPLDVTSTFDYLGRPQPQGRKSLSLAQSSGGGQVTAPVTPSVGERASAARSAAESFMANPGVDPLGISKEALGFAQEAIKLFGRGDQRAPGQTTGGGTPQAAASVAPDFPLAEGQPTQFNVGAEGAQQIGGDLATRGDEFATAVPADALTTTGGTTAGQVLGAAGQTIPYLGGALTMAQDIMANNPDDVKALNAAVDAAALALIPLTGGLSEVAAPLVKAEVGRTARDVKAGDVGKVIGLDLNPAALPFTLPLDVVEMFGGPDILSDIFGGGPSRYEAVRKAAAQGGQRAEGALAGGYAHATDPASLYSALGARAADRGSVRSYLTLPESAAGLPAGEHQWSELSPQQFMDVLRWLRDDPSRLQYVSGSGDVGYLSQGDAEALAAQTAGSARSAISRIIAGGLPEPAAPVTTPAASSTAPKMPEATVMPGGPAGALGFAKDLLESGP